MKAKINYFEIRHNGYALLFLVAMLFSSVIIAVHSFTVNWFMYMGLLVFCALLSFPVLFTTLKIQIQDDKITVVKTCGIRFKIMINEIKKVTVVKPDTVERKTNIVTRIKVYAGVKKFYVDSKMKNYDKFLEYIMKNADSKIIEKKIK